ncbi:hypothetical protein MTP10_21590 [Nonomuraea sp. 3-1Str]|uniref:hypothetical protein n=1 Tax=Nonomuraea sp. 3-1Str TaxID=2929801 RepID=UPI0028679E1E|nr:hypothetical protein [Nonomuraea sp. 3-1Str]MDR8411314.1 hypothetical protein [Nonomuraea sp. 3-1Str]
MSPERVILIVLAAVAAIAIAAALMLADGSTWPAALLTGLAAGGATLWGLLGCFGRNAQP